MTLVNARPTGLGPGSVRASALARPWRGLKILAPFAALVALWSGIKAGGDFPDRVLVSPAQVWQAGLDLVSRGILADYASTSLRMIGLAALISMLAGVPLGFAWLPLAIIWFGFTHQTTLVIVIYTLIVPIVFNTMTGVRAVPENYVLALRSLGAGRLRVVTDVYLPGALPSIVVGLRLGMGYGWRALIAAEMLVRRGGLGDLIFGARTFGQIDRIIVGMIVIGTLYIVVDRLLVQPIENLTVARWGVLRR